MAPEVLQNSLHNVSAHLRLRAEEFPERKAICMPDGSSISFAELEARCDALAHGLLSSGLRPGDRVCLFVRPGADLIALTHGMFRAGLIPVLIDPGMGRKGLLSCVERVAARGLVGIPRAQVARLLFPLAFASIEVVVTVGPRLAWGGASLAKLERLGKSKGAFPIRTEGPETPAAVLFTSGSTGPAKGVLYNHGNFIAQLEALKSLYQLKPGDVDVACFPLFALFDNALGMTSVFPDMDPSRPAACDPAKIYQAIEEQGASFSFGSPAIWKRLLPWCQAEGKRFSTLKRLTIAGAPVAPQLVEGLRALLPEGGDVHTPYGATESLPVSSASGEEITGELRAGIEGGQGTCVGRPAENIELCLVRISDDELPPFSQELLVAEGEVGEVCVRGRVATEGYLHDALATRRAKIQDPTGAWHRMGDLGKLDAEGRLWLQGRKSHRIQSAEGLVLPVPVENIYLNLPGVRRAALVGTGAAGAELPLLIIEPEDGVDRELLKRSVLGHRRELPATSVVTRVRFHDDFPVDVRHNAKIKREVLKRWAEAQA